MPTRASRTWSIPIERPLDDVYDYLSDPANFPKWAPVQDGKFEPVGLYEWRAELSFGVRMLQFAEPNEDGILDFSERADGGEAIVNPMRVVVNSDGCELIFTFFQRPWMNEAEFASATEWIDTDLWQLKSMLEARR